LLQHYFTNSVERRRQVRPFSAEFDQNLPLKLFPWSGESCMGMGCSQGWKSVLRNDAKFHKQTEK